jgi:hypothetical protein
VTRGTFERISRNIKPKFLSGMERPVFRNVFHEIDRNSTQNARSFNDVQRAIGKDFNDRFHLSSLMLSAGRRKAQVEKDDIRFTLSLMISNATVSLIGALELIRNGYRLQPGLLLRNSIEICATVLDIFMDKDRYSEYINRQLKSNKSITRASKAVSLLGKMYGLFSDMYVHINDLHSSDMRISGYSDPKEVPLAMNLFFSHMVLWVLLLVTELVFFDVVRTPRYWVQNEDKTYTYSATKSEKSWISSFYQPLQRIQKEMKK